VPCSLCATSDLAPMWPCHKVLAADTRLSAQVDFVDVEGEVSNDVATRILGTAGNKFANVLCTVP
jgi:hypothetical protein